MGRRLGQHFLVRGSVLERIARAACPEPAPRVIEIGPGKGALTAHLVSKAGEVIAIELDEELALRLRSRFPDITVISGDVLTTDLAQWGAAVVAGNLPYYITSPVIEKVLALGPLLTRAVFLIQKEVAQRLVAEPGSRDYGYLTVAILIYARAEYLFTVPPAAFHPPPKVESAVVRLTPHPPPVEHPEELLAFVGQCFRQKRKTIRNNLLPGYGHQVDAWPEAALRAEQLTLEQFAAMHRRLRGVER
ncbi:MAG TPA: 16S rRNA (adenine(1518)-N(6)/adenine(1519)-N(6))-dimethyltransferase RsmA [Bryobacteraceae bacterium]|nr:16S rRNA (adenine(1518)-N(6)/adenine(1519)-N(6))-dimethyltransferase RsmA [Bryobacteraceae bacterium]